MPFDAFKWLRLQYGPEFDYYPLNRPQDPILAKGRWRLCYPQFPELDPMDAPVKNSQVTLRVGEDTSHEPDQSICYRYNGIPAEEWRFKVLYLQNPTIKHIYDNWEISKEHPGMPFRNGLRSQWGFLKDHGDISFTHQMFIKPLLNFGGRYFDDPEGEQCFTKAWASMRFCLMATSFAWLMDISNGAVDYAFKPVAGHYLRLAYMPAITGWTWGAFTCLSCSMRGGTDDLINQFWGSVAAGTTWGMRFGAYRGWQVGVLTTLGTWLWRYTLDAFEGPFGTMPRVDVNMGDPQSWKWFKLETKFCDPYEAKC